MESQLVKKEIRQDVRVGMIGNVDAGKSTFIGMLVTNKLDNGRGLLRNSILKHKDERASGRTMDITFKYLKCEDSLNNVALIDLAGHEKYLKTTIKGINLSLNYSCLIIDPNKGMTKMTRQHLMITLAMKIPFMVVMTKHDLIEKQKFKQTLEAFNKIIKSLKNHTKECFIIQEDYEGNYTKTSQTTKVQSRVDNLGDVISDSIIPILILSHKTGHGTELARKFVMSLKPNREYNIDDEPHFVTETKYKIHGIGHILSGFVQSGRIKVGDILLLGSFKGKLYEVRIKDIHNNHRQHVKELCAGQGGCLNIKFTREELNAKHKIKRGLHIARNFKFVKKFKATVKILKHPTSIKKGYEAMLHSESISQNVKFIDLDGRDYLRIGDSCLVTFEFCHHAEFLFVDSRILLRDGNAKAYGNIVEILE